MGNNSGNMLFSEALYYVLDGARRSTYHFEPYELEGRDSIVVAAANWMDDYSDFGFLAERFEKIDLPVFLIGLGAQPIGGKQIPVLKPGTEKLIRIAAERSHALAVRGPFSAEVLEHYGVKNVTVTGCPSLLLSGSTVFPVRRAANVGVEDLALLSTRHLMYQADPFNKALYKTALDAQADVIFQSELYDLYYSDVHIGEQAPEDLDRVLAEAYGSPTEAVAAYLRGHGKFFYDLKTWLEYAAAKKLMIGTRFHGAITSLLAGTPAVLIAHDARTTEMAETMFIPHVRQEAVDPSSIDSLLGLYDEEAIGRFEHGYSAYRENFQRFFEAAGLPFRRAQKGYYRELIF